MTKPKLCFNLSVAQEVVKLSHIASPNARIGWQNLRRSEFKDDGDVYIITGTDFDNGRVNFKGCKFVDLDRYEMDQKIQIHENDILVTKDGTIGKVAIVKGLNKKATLNAGVFVLNDIVASVDREYLYHYLCSPLLLKFIKSASTGGTILHLNQSVLLNFPIVLPELKEQQKIAAFFRTVDEKIAIAREKITCLQKINGRLVRDVMDGKIRFSMRDGKGFPDWKREKLGESFSVKMCKRIFKEETLDVGDVPFYKIGTFGSEPDSYITQEQFELYKTKYSYPSAGDTLISCSGTVGRCVVFDGSPSYFQDSNIVWLESKESNFVYDKGYLTAVLQNFTWNELSSSTIKRIYSKDLLEKEWYVPCVEEQRLISKFIFELNEKVALEDKKLSCLINLKKSFMQQMFV